jgi:hypothetical protein
VGNLADMLTPEKNFQIVSVADHGQTVGAVTVTDGPDEGCLEGPNGMDQALFFKGAVQLEGLCLGEPFKRASIGSGLESLEKGIPQVEQFLRVKAQADAISRIVFPDGVLPADAGHADNGVGQREHMFQIFERNNLPKMISTKFCFVILENNLAQPSRGLKSLLEVMFKLRKGTVAYFPDKIAQVPTPFHVRKELTGVMLGLEIPPFPFPMLVAELAHDP